MKIGSILLFGILILPLTVSADRKPQIKVMTQNQYIGTSLVPLINSFAIPDPSLQADAVLAALHSIADSNVPERIEALAESISERKPHLVGLQEVVHIECEVAAIAAALQLAFDPCEQFAAASGFSNPVFNDHLEQTLLALEQLGVSYTDVAVVESSPITIPVSLDGFPPIITLTVRDRNVILARDGNISVGTPIHRTYSDNALLERSFVAVNARVRGADYLFVNTHLEVPLDLAGPQIQALQAAELVEFLGAADTDDDTHVVVLGDFNSSKEDPYVTEHPTLGTLKDPYRQLLDAGYVDTWEHRKGRRKQLGYTCCQQSDLINAQSQHSRRIDLIFGEKDVRRVYAKVLDNKLEDLTPSMLWPSDHSSVRARLRY